MMNEAYYVKHWQFKLLHEKESTMNYVWFILPHPQQEYQKESSDQPSKKQTI